MGATALAGCGSQGRNQAPSSADGGSGSEGNNTGSTAQSGEQSIEHSYGGTIPTDVQWNPWSGQDYSGMITGFAIEYGGLLDASGNITPIAFKEWSYDEDRHFLEVTLRDDLKNWNGNKFTSEDLLAYYSVSHWLNPESSRWKNLTAPDKSTLQYHYKEPQNPQIAATYDVHGTVVGYSKELWEPWMNKLRNAADQSERDKIAEELKNFTVSHQKMMDKGWGTSAFKLKSVGEQNIEYEVWDGHRLADEIEVRTLRLPFAATNSREDELITNDKVDFGSAPLSGRLKGAKPDHIQNLTTWEAKWLIKMLINWKNREYLQDANVRRAMACVIDSENIVSNVGQGYSIKIHSGMDTNFTKQYAGEQANEYLDYGTKKNYEKADEFLEMSGYSRENGTVLDPDGNELETLRFVTGTGNQWFVAGRAASSQLKEYGFPVEFTSVERSTKLDIIENKMGDWDLTTESHYAAGTNHPISYFNWGSFWGWRLTKATFSPDANARSNIKKWLENGEESSPYNGKPLTPEIPTQVGAKALDGETKTINIYDLFEESFTPISEERTKEIISDLSWAWNFHLPDIDLYTTRQGVWGDTKNFEWPSEEKLQLVNGSGTRNAVKQGLVKFKDN
ncbi:ABC transporter substrate-binding protein [Halogranum amylolyticum]|nr:ABC transporter substrate-binding protein [Halogranum amylolyticum]